MTRDEFEEFMDGEQWTSQQRQSFANKTPVGSPALVRNEMQRPDGIIEVTLTRRPFLRRLRNHYYTYRDCGFSRLQAFASAWTIARI